jgi:hypothetical protein
LQVALMSALDAALSYHRRGWAVVAIPRGQKGPRHKGWSEQQVEEAALPALFHSGWQGQNEPSVGILLGPRSSNLVDLDLDCTEALVLSDIYLPNTSAEFGRASKPRSHRLYVASGAIYEAFTDPVTGEVLLELRAEGRGGGAHQTMAPPSVHPSGEPVQWHGATIAPAAIDAVVLRRRAVWLGIGCLVLRYVGEGAARKPGPDMPALLWEFDRELGRAAFRWLEQPAPDAPRERPRPRAAQHHRDLDLAEVVAAIPNDCGWEDWNRVGMALFAASKDQGDGFVIFDDFSARSHKYNSRETAERWEGYRRTPPTRIGMGTLVHLAKQAGWKPKRESA